MEDFWGCILVIASITYFMFLVSLMTVLVIQNVSYVTMSVLVTLLIASVIMFMILYKYNKE